MTLRMSMKEAKKFGIVKSPRQRKGRAVGSVTKIFERACVANGLPEPVAEYQFCPDRGFKFDYAFVAEKLAIEIEGGLFGSKPCPVCRRRAPGGHSSISGIKRDIEKYNLGILLGWRIVRCLPEDVSSGFVFALLRRYLVKEKA